MSENTRTPTLRRHWLVPMGMIALVAVTVFWAFYSLDFYVTGGTPQGEPAHPLARYFNFDPGAVSGAATALGGLIAAVLGIVITVVSIVVQLAAGRHGGVAGMFFRDRTNLVVMGYYVISCVIGIWVSTSVRADFVPRAVIVLMILTATVALALMAPFFAYVFWFLEIGNIIARIRAGALEGARTGGAATESHEISGHQIALVQSMEEFTDIASTSISGKDKTTASAAVDALKDFACSYIQFKGEAVPSWFQIGYEVRRTPDFVAMDPESRTDLEKRKTWVEWKVMRQYLGIYHEALGQMRDINYLVAIDTRYIGEAACSAGDDELITLVLRFMNSYMRSTLNAKDVRTAYNIMNQYRLLAEFFLRAKNGKAAVQAVEHMRYYAFVSYEMKLTFVTETIAYDVCALCQLAHEVRAKDDEDRMLTHLLQIDRPLDQHPRDSGLAGVRKAQSKLAAYYLLHDRKALADRIREDMRIEPPARMKQIRDELLRVETKDFWEIIDRGRNFEYMPPEQKAKLKEFYSWLDETTPTPAPAVVEEAMPGATATLADTARIRMG